MAAIWGKIKAACWNSVTMAWSYLVTLFGTILANIDALAAALGDPNLNQQVSAVLGDAKAVGKWLLIVGVITAIARMKSIIIQKKD